MVSNCEFVTFPCGILGQVWYLIVSIPDLCNSNFVYFQDVPFYIFSESYGGKMAAVISKYLYKVSICIEY